MSSQYAFDFSYAYGKPVATGLLRQQCEDFQVDEQLGFEPCGEGEHSWLLIRKRDTNTEWLARQLARLAGVTSREIGYSGMKDKQAVTTQWFSVHLPGKPDPDWQQLCSESIEILKVCRHNSKLRRGTHKSNRFSITLRDVAGDHGEIEQRLEQLRTGGFPNYFGEQRFGSNGQNLDRGIALLKGEIKVKDRHKRSLYLSAARSYLFNLLLSERVSQGNWNQILPGEVASLEGSNSVFEVAQLDDEIIRRCEEMDIHPSGPLWGKGALKSMDQAQALEMSMAADYHSAIDGMGRYGLKQARRALRVKVSDLSVSWPDSGQLNLCFELRTGSFATSFLREVLSY